MPFGSHIQLFQKARDYGNRLAVVSRRGDFSYRDLLSASAKTANGILSAVTRLTPERLATATTRDLAEAPIAFLTHPDENYIACQWGIWRAGGIAVPLCVKHPRPELEYVLDDTGASIVIADDDHHDRLRDLAAERSLVLLRIEDLLANEPAANKNETNGFDENRRAMILYTSGTTSRPKGVVSTHANIRYQTETLLEAWRWQSEDRILNVLPLHHAHGILNILTCALRAGATLEMARGFEPRETWSRLSSGELTLFMAVPTIYVKLIAAHRDLPDEVREHGSRTLRNMRLMVSGSAALPVQVLEEWREISGHVLLERYGMTELGMALSNPYEGERRPGFVGRPLPGVELRLMKEDGTQARGDEPGEIQVRGPGVFLEYWRRTKATAEAFRDGWFLTGDIAQWVDGSIRIMGRNSTDIIKSGGYKISALEIEQVLRDHPDILDCSVVGLPHSEYGELICALIVPRLEPPASGARELPADFAAALRAWAGDRMGAYKVPRRWFSCADLPRNVMGKVLKNEVKEMFG